MEIISVFFSKLLTFICYLLVIILAVYCGYKLRLKKENKDNKKGNI